VEAEVMRQFVWDGVVYEFDAEMCYDTDSLVRLPDGRMLRVTGWYEVLPPKPAGFNPLTFVAASKVTDNVR
jgi:hypothetical protein